MKPRKQSALVPDAWEGARLDRFLAEYVELANRSQLKSRGVTAAVNGEAARFSRKLAAGDLVEAELPPLELQDISPEEIDLDIIYENRDVIVLNKPQGVVVHPGAGNHRGTLVNALVHYSRELRAAFGEESELRPGIVHRLDKETSGVMIAAKHPVALDQLARRFKSRETDKQYMAILRCRPPETIGRVEGFIRRDPRNRKRFIWSAVEGKAAQTEYRVVRHLPEEYTLIRFAPRTGRTHQLRVHAAHLHAPILGDPVYSRRDQRFPEATMMLHAASLTITLPGENEPRRFQAPLPSRFREIVDALLRRV